MGRSDNNMAVALFGGTFNPVHIGHLRIATELAELLQVDHLRLLPCAFPPHRGEPQASAQQRLAMLAAATANQSILVADDMELQRAAPSYSIDTLALMRQQIGDTKPLFFCIGMDALIKINTWHCWQELLLNCHIVLSSRPNTEQPDSVPVADRIAQHRCDALDTLQQRPARHPCVCDVTRLAIDATGIREKIAQGKSINFMTPDTVVEYIQQHHLYE